VINKALVRNNKPYPPSCVGELEILPGVKDALIELQKSGYKLIVVTNQPDVARGKTLIADVVAINDFIMSKLPIDDIRVCFHDESDMCSCRKPRPGLIVSAARDHKIDLSRSYMVGDRWRDIAAGNIAGCKTFFIDYCYSEINNEIPDFTVTSLEQAKNIILSLPY